MNYAKLSDIREALEKTLGHPVSRQLEIGRAHV